MPEPYYRDESFKTSQEESRRSRRERERAAKKKGGVVEFIVILLVSFVLVFGFVRPFVVEAFRIPSESMVPTLEVGDRVLANKFIYRFTDPKRGDIVVFRSMEGPQPQPPSSLFERVREWFFGAADEPPILIKRVVGTPGDRIAVQGGKLFVNGELQKEPYVNKAFPDRSFFAPTTVPKGYYFMMGDNRANSRDSRFFGPVPKENIEGEAFLRFWPPNRIGLL